MSKLDIINSEIARREQAIENFRRAEKDLLLVIEEFNKLDEFYRDQEKDSRELLECIYAENRHFTGEWPIVYDFATVEKLPYFKETDAECNPYFPISKVKDGTFDGIAPLIADPGRTGAYQRQRSYGATEDIPRGPALTALLNFPDITNEPLPPGWPGPQETNSTGSAACYYAVGATEPICTSNGGEWVLDGDLIPDPTWNGPDTAPALLRVPLQAWRDDVQTIIDDLCDDSGTELAFWQAILDDMDTVLAAVASDAVFVRATGDTDPGAWGQTQSFSVGSPEETAYLNLISAAQTDVPNHVATRITELNGEADTEEQIFFGLINLRLHQVNGSYSKLQAAKGQIGQSDKLIEDNQEAIATLNLMKVKNS